MHEWQSRPPARTSGTIPAPTAAHTPAKRLLGLQRDAGNRRTGALLRAHRALQRSIEDDLRAAPPPEPIAKGRVDLPAGTAKWTEGEQNWRIPMRLYAIEEIPRELDGLKMLTGLRATADAPLVIHGEYTIADIRREGPVTAKADRCPGSMSSCSTVNRSAAGDLA